MPHTRITCFVLLLFPVLGWAQAGTEKASDDQQLAPAIAEPYQGGWSVPVDDARKEAELSRKDLERPASLGAQQQLDQLRWDRNASLARNAGDIPAVDQRRLVELAMELNSTAPNSFEAHMANYYTQFPAPSAFAELDQATDKGAAREELIAPLLVNAARTGDAVELTVRAKDMKARGRIAPPLYQVANDILASVEPGAILFAAGEMDAYPLWVEQYANGRSKDLLVVDVRLLADPGYRAIVWRQAKARGSVAGESSFIGSLAAATARPVYLSLALGAQAMAPLQDRLYVTGLAMRLSDAPVDNLPLLEGRWDRLKKPLNAGPLSRNYLVPGSVLLTHYRAIGDEPRAARLEHELRTMANQLGATNALLRSGVLPH
ncbi:MAG TPA: hypothetical protein PKJ19_06305 [Flavobacteriales bacterium]|nr:hypothetical protein [Flavobacteriales bacterium]HNU57514.1 hypothetical protein [Flavobacteriales bacterium]